METVDVLRNALKNHDPMGEQTAYMELVRGLPEPVRHKPYPEDAMLIDKTTPKDLTFGAAPLIDVINRRRSRRLYTDEPLNLDELSFLLWATQGVKRVGARGRTLRTVPSACFSNPFETYLSVHRIAGLEAGLYRYIPLEHRLCLLHLDPDIAAKVTAFGSTNQFVIKSAVLFVWTAFPRRSEWWGGLAAYKWCCIEAGHVCQNLYLACTAIGAGACAIAGWDDEPGMQALVGIDGKDEVCVYYASVGKVKPGRQDEYMGRIKQVETEGETTRLWVRFSFPLQWPMLVVVELPRRASSGYAEGDEAIFILEPPQLHSEYQGDIMMKGIEIRRPE